MNRIEKVRECVDDILLHMKNESEQKCAYVHLYGVAQASALIALRRNENIELAVIAGMLHDIYSYATLDTNDHAHKGCEMAKEILSSLELFSEAEIDQVAMAVYNHGNKEIINEPFDEILIDADVMQHYLYNPLEKCTEKERLRIERLKSEFHLC